MNKPWWQPCDVPRAANCKNCGRRIYAQVRDTYGEYQAWRHYDQNSWGSAWCYLDPELGSTMADPDVLTYELLKALTFPVVTFQGYRGHWPREVSFYRPKHRKESAKL